MPSLDDVLNDPVDSASVPIVEGDDETGNPPVSPLSGSLLEVVSRVAEAVGEEKIAGTLERLAEQSQKQSNSQELQLEKKARKSNAGRPKWIPPDLGKIESMAALGMSQRQIAEALGIHEATLCEKKREFTEFGEAINRGKAKGIATVANKLMEKVRGLDTASIIFYLKCHAGWKETGVLELTGKDGGPIETKQQVQIYLPDNGRDGKAGA